MNVENIEIAKLNLDIALQGRPGGANEAVIDKYAEAFRENAVIPPIAVFDDGRKLRVPDGAHRMLGAAKAGRKEIEARVRQGTERDAFLYMLSANATHGLHRDSRHIVKVALQDPELAKLSDREIARKCKVGNGLVSDIRAELSVCKNTDAPGNEAHLCPGTQMHPGASVPADTDASKGGKKKGGKAGGNNAGGKTRTIAVKRGDQTYDMKVSVKPKKSKEGAAPTADAVGIPLKDSKVAVF